MDGYRLYRGHASRTYGDIPIQVENAAIDGVVTKTVDDLADGTTYYFAVTAYNSSTESGYSNEVIYTSPAPESVSQPRPPGGPAELQAGVSYVFTATGALSSTGDAVQYRFFWSDGTDSDWLPVGTVEASKSWDIPATYTDVRVQARCAAHPSVVSPLSEPVTIVVTEAPAETVSQPSAPTGPTAVTTLQSQTYATGGSASSLGHPLEYRFLWADGTVSPWLAIGATEAAKSWSLPGTYAVRSEARCADHPTVHSTPSTSLDVLVSAAPGESVSPPSAPAGPGDGLTGLVYGYTTGGAASSTGDPLEYRFLWGDGTASPWLTPGATGAARAWKSWPAEGLYSVVAEARCALHPSLPAASAPTAVSVAGGNSLLIADTFSDGTAAGDPQWRKLSGRWVVGADRTLSSGSRTATNRAVVRAFPSFRAGRISTRLKLPTRESLTNGAGIVFALGDTRHYRYVSIRGSRIVLGQVGDTPGVSAGVKASAARPFRAGQWYTVRADIYPGGRVLVYLGNATTPVLTYRFADTISGSIGLQSHKSVTHFDDFRAWDARALP